MLTLNSYLNGQKMKEREIIDITFIDNSLKEKAKILIADALRERGGLAKG